MYAVNFSFRFFEEYYVYQIYTDGD